MVAVEFEQSVKVLVVDDHAGIRRAVVSLIDAESPRMSSIGSAANAREAIALVQEHQPNVVVLDVDLGGDDGLALIPVLRRLAPCQIVVLTSLTDPSVAEQACRLGAYTCLNKMAPAVDLIAAVFAADRASATVLLHP